MPLLLVEPPVVAEGRTNRLVSIPASAGFPSPAANDLEDEINPIAWIVRHPASTFWWRIEDDCFLDAGILDDDLIAVDQAGGYGTKVELRNGCRHCIDPGVTT